VPTVNDILIEARTKAAEPVRVPWRAALEGFLVGFLAALLPAAFVTHVVADVLPSGSAVVTGGTAQAFAAILALVVGLAVAVCRAARSYDA